MEIKFQSITDEKESLVAGDECGEGPPVEISVLCIDATSQVEPLRCNTRLHTLS